jgi:1,4-alpha-glucan branching enzyme
MRYSFLLISALFAFAAQAQTTTFNVDMTCAPEGFTDVFVTGPWCDWCANDVYNTMTDPDGDGIYSVTLDSTVTGLIEYKYAINGFADQENLVNDMVAGASCAPVTDYNGYANRQIQQGSVANDYYGSCDGVCNDSPPVDITFQVDMSQYAGAYTTVNLNGSFNGWCGGCAAMTDDDGDGIYALTVTVAPDTIEYKFTVDGWTVQENFAGGEACTSTIDGYTNRSLAAYSSQTLDPVCWNSCDACVQVEHAVTFQVDMNDQTTNPIGVFIAGNFQGWSDGATAMTDADGDDVWEYTAMIAEGTAVEYKFINGPNWGLDESVPVACAVNGNRGFTVGTADAVLDAVCFGACTPCGTSLPTEEVTFTVLTDNIEVAADGMFLAGAMNGWSSEAMSDNGDGSWSITKSLEVATYEFKFQNGEGGWEELECGGNRSVVVTLGSPIATQGCFGQCAEVCAIDPDAADVTFQVDASQIDVDSAGMYLIGSFTSPAWQFGAIAMDDADGDGIWTTTVNISGPASFQYKFNNGLAVVDSVADYSGEENADFLGLGCGVDNGVGGSNRLHVRSGVAETLAAVCFNSCDACVEAPAALVATVDLCGQSATEVRLTGPFWGWDPGAGPVATDNGDGTWSITFDPAPDADMEYLWIVDGVQENLVGLGDCTPVTDGATYANRLWTVGSADISDVYASCTGCDTTGGGSTTFNVDMSCVDAAGSTVNGSTTFAEVFVTGPWCDWCAADGYNVLTDDDGDGIYSVEIADLTGSVEYKYGIDGFADQENLVDDMANGASCAPVTDYAGYANRLVDAGSTTNDTFGSCDSCGDQVSPADVTFNVDMNQYAEAYAYSGVFLNGSFNGWCGTCNPMDDSDGDGVWSVTLSLAPGTVEYKFTLDGWNYQEEFGGVEGVEGCTSTIDGFTNRSLTFDADIALDAVCWESCEACAAATGGCTNPEYLEFDPYATSDDGSCNQLIVLGCIYDAASNFNPIANVDDNSCEFSQTNDCAADLDGDGSVTTGDLLAFLATFGLTCL